MKIFINPSEEIDYSILEKCIIASEESPVSIISDSNLERMVLSKDATLDEITEFKKLILRRNRLLDRKKFCFKSKAGANLNKLGECYRKGVVTMSERHLVRVNLSTCIMTLIQVISNLGNDHTDNIQVDLSDVEETLGSIISGSCGDDLELQDTMRKLYNKDNVYLKAYINKAFALSDTRDVIIKDAFNIQRTYASLSPIECFSLPLSNSLNHLVYAIVEGIDSKLLKTDKKFAIADDYNLYYFVKDKALTELINLQVYLDGKLLDIKVDTVGYKVNV